MINKKQIKQRINKIRRLRTWQLVILLLISLLISATFLRLNNIGMVERRNAVLNADLEGDEQKVEDRLYELQRYVSSHMNTDMGKGIYLENLYQQAVKIAYDNASKIDSQDIYKKARDICDPKFSSWSPAYVACVSDELSQFPEGQELSSVVIKPSPELYLHVFSSPNWSSDYAGWSVLISVSLAMLISMRIISYLLLYTVIKFKFYNN